VEKSNGERLNHRQKYRARESDRNPGGKPDSGYEHATTANPIPGREKRFREARKGVINGVMFIIENARALAKGGEAIERKRCKGRRRRLQKKQGGLCENWRDRKAAPVARRWPAKKKKENHRRLPGS